jgi:hypothetical protein
MNLPFRGQQDKGSHNVLTPFTVKRIDIPHYISVNTQGSRKPSPLQPYALQRDATMPAAASNAMPLGLSSLGVELQQIASA